MAGKKGTTRHVATEDEMYAYYVEQYRKKSARSNYAKKSEMILPEYFEMAYGAVKNKTLEKGRRYAWYRIVDELVDKQVFAYRRGSAVKQAAYINSLVSEGESKISYKDIQSGTARISDSLKHEIYIAKKEEYKAKYKEMFPDAVSNLMEAEGISYEAAKKKVDRAMEKYSVKSSHDWMSEHIFGSK